MRYYTTEPLNGGTAFKCCFCRYIVNTVDFNNTSGNRRTQAATMINQHATALHFSSLRPVSGRSRWI
jgi:hypothetical protein